MRILFLLTQDLESPSGLGRYFPLAKGLAQNGHRVTIAALHPNFKSLKERRFQQDGVAVRYLSPMHVRKDEHGKCYYIWPALLGIGLLATLRLTWAALTIPADLILLAKPHPMNSLAGLLAKWLRRRRLILDCDDYEAASGNFSHVWQKWLVARFEQSVPHLADQITTHTAFMAGKLTEWGAPEEKISMLPNPIDLERFRNFNPVQTQQLAERWNLSESKVVLFAGSLSLASHAVDRLLEAFAIVQSIQPQSRLLLVGDGEDRPALKQMARRLGIYPKTIFAGRIPPDQMGAVYRLGTLSVDPVRDDDACRGRSPVKMLESWACGLPFVTADVGQRQALMGQPPAGLLVKQYSADALAEGILYLLQNRRQAEIFRQRGLERVARFSCRQMAAQMEPLLQPR